MKKEKQIYTKQEIKDTAEYNYNQALRDIEIKMKQIENIRFRSTTWKWIELERQLKELREK
jgi:hypothetical protein